MGRAVVGRWGRSLAIRIPADVASAAGIGEGQQVEVQANDGAVVIRPAAPRYTLEELFRGKTAMEWQRQYAKAYDWGPDVGREIVDE